MTSPKWYPRLEFRRYNQARAMLEANTLKGKNNIGLSGLRGQTADKKKIFNELK
jgi:hypothetical protein